MRTCIRVFRAYAPSRCARSIRIPRVPRIGASLAIGFGVGCRAYSSAEWKSAFVDSQLSFARGPNEPPLLQMTIPEHFRKIVSKHGSSPAVLARTPYPNPQTTTLTYSALDTLSNRLASSLRTLGVQKGDRLAVCLGNVAEFAALTYAAFKLGAILVPLNPTFGHAQVASALAHLGANVLVIGAVTDLSYRPGNGRSNEGLLRALVPDLSSGRIEAPEVPTLRKIVVLDNRGFHPQVSFPLEEYRSLTLYDDLLDGSPDAIVPDAPLDPSDTINIQFTSGTTSHPKAAMLTHTSILNNGALIAQRMGLVPEDKIVVPPPLFHCFGCVLGYMATATTGAAILFPSPAFDPLASLEMAVEHDATGLYGVSTMLVAILETLASGKVPSPPKNLLKGIVAGSSVPEALMRRVYSALGLQDLVICYGMTETSPVSCMTTPTDPFEKRTSSVGRPMPHTAVKVVDPHDPSILLPIGERGELVVSGYLVMQGYYSDPQRTAEVRTLQPAEPHLPSSKKQAIWMHTGDEASMDEKGYVEITGRIKDLIIRGGENIHPLEVENCLFQHPVVAEASVVGVPDAKYGEVVGAFVILHQNHAPLSAEDLASLPDELRAWVKKHLSGHLSPRYVFFVDAFPKTASGKIQKFKLRDLAKERLEEEGIKV